MIRFLSALTIIFCFLGNTLSSLAGELHDAVRSKDVPAVKALIQRGATLDETDFQVGTPLHVAVSQGSADIAGILIDHGADVEASSELQQGARALHLAAGFGDIDTVTLLIGHDADIEARDHGGLTPLIHAASAGQESTVRLLLDAGAGVDVKGGQRQRTPFLSAAYFGHQEVVKLLVEHGADINASDRHGENALHFAVGMAAYSNTDGQAFLEYLVMNGTDLNAMNNAGLTPIAYAKIRGHPDATEVMRRLGASE